MPEATITVRIPEGYECLGYGIVSQGEYFLNSHGELEYNATTRCSPIYAIRLAKLDPLKGLVEALETLNRATETRYHSGCKQMLTVLNLVKFVRDIGKLSPEAFASLSKLSLLETKQLVERAIK